ncbi:unnamed protein product, partial [Rotaria sp. Silwood1]
MTMSDNYPLDFRLIASSQFQMLALLCRTANTIVLDAIKQFVSSEMMSNNILFRANFEVQIAALVEQLQSTISADASRTNQLLLLSYFEACAPKVCTYSYPQRFSLAYIMTTLISIIGGLSVA